MSLVMESSWMGEVSPGSKVACVETRLVGFMKAVLLEIYRNLSEEAGL